MKRIIIVLLLSLLAFQFAGAQNHVTLVYTGDNADVIAAVKKANEILSTKAFYDEIRKVAYFDNSKLTGREVADRMEKANQQVVIIRKFKPIANASTKTSDKIKLSRSLFGEDSTGKFLLSIAVNTLIHETVHAVDFLGTGDEFTHDGNKKDGQENTAPWVIGAIAEKMVEDQK
jgi:hypothetical protein